MRQRGNAIHDGEPLRIVLIHGTLRLTPPPCQQPAALLMDLPADGLTIRIISGRGQHDHRLLEPGRVGAHRQDVPQPPVGLGVQLVDDNSRKAETVLGVGVAAVDLHHAAEPCPDLSDAVPAPCQRPVCRLAQCRVLHHVLGALVDDIRVGLIGGENAHLRAALAVIHQQIQPQPCRKLALAVLLGDLVIQKPAVSHPLAAIVADLDAEELPDGPPLPLQKVERLTGPLVLAKHQHGEEFLHTVHLGLVVPEFRAVIRRRYLDTRRQRQHLRHTDPCLPGSAPAWGCCPPSPACRYPAPPGGSGWLRSGPYRWRSSGPA